MRTILKLLTILQQAANGLSAPVNSVLPVISGTPTVGQLLSTTDGTWSGSPTFTYQWKRDGVNIGSATANTYTLVSADAGAVITVTVTATNAAGSASATSAGTSAVSHTYVSLMTSLSLTMWHRYREAAGATTAVNSGTSGSAMDGTLTAVTLEQTGLLGVLEAGSFNGTTSLNSVPSNSTHLNQSFSYGFCIKPNNAGEGNSGALYCRDNSFLSGGLIWNGNTNSLLAKVTRATTNADVTATVNFGTSAYGWIFLTFDLTNGIRIYKGISGVVAEAAYTVQTVGSGAVNTGNNAIVIGNRTDGALTFNGNIDEDFYIANTVLTSDQMTQITLKSAA